MVRLQDLISHADLSLYPQVALVIFTGVFLVVAMRVWRRPRAAFNHAAGLALEDGVRLASPQEVSGE